MESKRGKRGAKAKPAKAKQFVRHCCTLMRVYPGNRQRSEASWDGARQARFARRKRFW